MPGIGANGGHFELGAEYVHGSNHPLSRIISEQGWKHWRVYTAAQARDAARRSSVGCHRAGRPIVFAGPLRRRFWFFCLKACCLPGLSRRSHCVRL